MRVTFLGTGAAGGVPLYGCDCPACARARRDPAHQRRPCSALLESGDDRILVDAGLTDLHQRFPAGSLSTILLTHFHTDHAGGLQHFPGAEIFAAQREISGAVGWTGRIQGYLPHRWPSWFRPVPISFPELPFGAFERSFPVSVAGDVMAVPTPGHTPGHLSVVVRDGDLDYFLAGDTSYTQEFLLAEIPDGVSPRPSVTLETMGRILAHAAAHPTIYLPSHDPESVARLRQEKTLPGGNAPAVRRGGGPG